MTLAKSIEEAGASIINTGIGWHEARIPTIATSVPRAGFSWVTKKLKGEVCTSPLPLVCSISTTYCITACADSAPFQTFPCRVCSIIPVPGIRYLLYTVPGTSTRVRLITVTGIHTLSHFVVGRLNYCYTRILRFFIDPCAGYYS